MADGPEIEEAAVELRQLGVQVEALRADLATIDGVDALYDRAQQIGRFIDALFANAGRGLGKGFLDQDFETSSG